MKQLITSLLMCLCISAFAQNTEQDQEGEMETLLGKKKKETTYGGFGAPVFRISGFYEGGSAQVGGRGGVIFNHKLAFGGYGLQMVNEVSVVTMPGDPQLSFFEAGLFLEYILKYNKAIHLSFPLELGNASYTIEDQEGEEIASGNAFLINPQLKLNFNLSKSFVPAVYVGYRLAIGNNIEAPFSFTDGDLSGIYAGLEFKFGEF